MNLNETGKQTKETEETITEKETVKLSSLETSPKKDECLELKNIKYKTMLMNGTTIQETKPSSDLDNLEKFLESEDSSIKLVCASLVCLLGICRFALQLHTIILFEPEFLYLARSPTRGFECPLTQQLCIWSN